MGTVSTFLGFVLFLLSLRTLLRLKGAARRPHRGPTGKKEPNSTKKEIGAALRNAL